MIGIIGAMQVEIEGLCSLIENCTTKELFGRKFYSGYIRGKEVVVVESGIGKVNAAVTTSILCDNYNIDIIINTGVAGGIGNIKTFDLVISDKLLYHDFDLTPIGYKKGVIPGTGKMFEANKTIINICENIAKEKGISYHIGNIASGDIFATNPNIIDGLEMNILAVEMEGAAIAHTAKIYDKPFIALRVISDILGSKNQEISFNQVEKKAAEYASLFVFEIMNKLVLTK